MNAFILHHLAVGVETFFAPASTIYRLIRYGRADARRYAAKIWGSSCL